MRIKVLIALILALLGGCYVANGQTLIGRPLKPITSGGTLPLDEVNGAWGAYSVTRKLRSAYSGPAFRVSNGSISQDIGFSGDLVDTNTLVTFAGAGSAYLTTLYDQADNAVPNDLNVIPTVTNCFRLVESGTLLLDPNGYPWARSKAGSVSYIRRSLTTPSGTTLTYLVVFTANANTNQNVFLTLSSTEGGNFRQIVSGGNKVGLNSSGVSLTGPAYSVGTQYLGTCVFNASSTDSVQLNDGAATVGDAGSSTTGAFCIGYQSSAITADYNFSEVFVFAASVSAGDTDILQDNINAFYTLW